MLEERQGRTHAQFVVFSGHVHNYEASGTQRSDLFCDRWRRRSALPNRANTDDPLNGKSVNYHYLLVEVDPWQPEDHHAPSRLNERRSRLDATGLGRDLRTFGKNCNARPVIP